MKNLFIILLSIVLFSCEEVVEIKTPVQGQQIAVEGKIINEKGTSYVKLMYTGSYFSQDESQAVRNAVVMIADENGVTVAFNENAPGFYQCPSDFVGASGSTYSMEVRIDSHTLTAVSTMPRSVGMDRARLEHVGEGDAFRMKGYHMYATVEYDKSSSNYFVLDRFVNGARYMKTAGDIEVFDDRFLTGITSGEETMLGYWSDDETDDQSLRIGDVIEIRMCSISRDAFDYLSVLKSTPTMGGMFGKNPADVPSNIDGGLGLFHAVAYGTPKTLAVE